MGKKLILASFLLALFSNAQDNFFKDFREKNLTNVVYDNGMNGSKKKYPNDPVGKEGNDGKWPGIGPENEAPNTAVLHYTRIPSMVITNDNKIIVMYDLRWYKYGKDKKKNIKSDDMNMEILGNDHGRIDAGVSISSDGGKTWENHTAISFNDKWHGNNPQINRRRIMDATLLYNHLTGDLYTLHGSWNEFLSSAGGELGKS